MDKKKATFSGSLARAKVQRDCNTVSPIQTTERQAQRDYILSLLRTGKPFSTLDFRNLGICSPASRIIELRRDGHNIALTWQHETDSAGVIHRIGVYSLIGGAA